LISSEPPPIILECRINEETNIKIYEDEPIIISLSIINDEAIQAALHNTPLEVERQELERKYEENRISEKEYKSAVEEIERNKLSFRTYRFGSPKGWIPFIQFRVLSTEEWSDLNWPLKLLMYDPPDNVVELNASTSCYIEWGLDPQDSTQVSRGEYQLKAIAKIMKPVESNVVTLTFIGEKLSKAITNSEEQLLARGRYYYKSSLFQEAKDYAERALKINSNSLEALVLLGNIEEKRGNYVKALEAYELAEKADYTQKEKEGYEPPEYIISKIITLTKLLEESG
jgi:tetratricopeptide (TPR) repeat protein